jgi:hypothetical protein
MRKILTRLTTTLACTALLGLSAAAIADDHDQSNNGPGAIKAPKKTPEFPTCYYVGAVFESADDVVSCSVAKTEDTAAGILRVRTADCCILGDLWQSEILADQPRWQTDVGVGDGSSAYSGDAYVGPFVAGVVEVSYFDGTDIFPAGMTIEICYSRENEDGSNELAISCD